MRRRELELTSNRGLGTVRERIAGVAGVTRTDWSVINCIASGLQSTGSWAGVSAPQASAGHRLGAVGILGTLGSASFVRVTYVVWQTGTGTDAAAFAADRICAARGRLAWFPNV